MSITVIGAGKTGRGFIGRLLAESGKEIRFIDKDAALVAAMNAKKAYRISFFGGKREDFEVSGYTAFTWEQVSTVTDELILQFEGHKLLLTHGHHYHVKSGYGALLARAVRAGADIVLFGHTHLPISETVSSGSEICGVAITHPIYLFNPGSIGQGGSFGTLGLRGENVLLSHGRV